MHHIRATLPDIKVRITEQQKKFNAELQSLGGMVADNPVRIIISLALMYNLLIFRVQGSVVLSAITEFSSGFRGAIDGNRDDLAQNELSGGARISFVFHELYNNAVKSFDPFDQIKDGDIRVLLYNSSVCLLPRDLHLNHIPFLLTVDKLFRAPPRVCSWTRVPLRPL